MVTTWTLCGFQMDTTWFPCGHHMVSMWTSCDFEAKTLLCQCGNHLVSMWKPCGLHLETTWCPHVNHMMSMWIPIFGQFSSFPCHFSHYFKSKNDQSLKACNFLNNGPIFNLSKSFGKLLTSSIILCCFVLFPVVSCLLFPWWNDDVVSLLAKSHCKVMWPH